MSYSPEIFNKFKEPLDKSRNEFVRIILQFRPEFAHYVYSESDIKKAYDLWSAQSRAMDAALGTAYYKHTEMLPIPPNDDEHKVCRHMWSVTMERLVYGHISIQSVKEALDHLKSTDSWEYHDLSCGCHSMRQWENCYGDEAKMIHDFSTLPFGKTMTICKLPACPQCEKEDARDRAYYESLNAGEQEKSWVFVKSYGYGTSGFWWEPRIHDVLFGHYTIQKTPTNYIFTLMKPANRDDLDLIGRKSMVPLSVKMGEGDFDCVRPEHIMPRRS